MSTLPSAARVAPGDAKPGVRRNQVPDVPKLSYADETASHGQARSSLDRLATPAQNAFTADETRPIPGGRATAQEEST